MERSDGHHDSVTRAPGRASMLVVKPESNPPEPGTDDDFEINLDEDFTRDTEPVAVPSVRPPPMHEFRLLEDADLGLHDGFDHLDPRNTSGERTTRPEQIVPPPEARLPAQRRRVVPQIHPFGEAPTEPPPPRVLQPVAAPNANTNTNAGANAIPNPSSSPLTVPPARSGPTRVHTAALIIAGTILGAALTAFWSQHQRPTPDASPQTTTSTRADTAPMTSAVAPPPTTMSPAPESVPPPAPPPVQLPVNSRAERHHSHSH